MGIQILLNFVYRYNLLFVFYVLVYNAEMIMDKRIFFFLLLVVVFCKGYSQPIVCKQVHYPTDNTHASSLSPNLPKANTYLMASVWAPSGVSGIVRGYINFDLLNIFSTTNTFMNTANLYLYNPYTADPEIRHEYQYTTLPTQAVFHRVISGWDETTLTWNNQPEFDTLRSVTSPVFCTLSNPSYEDLALNVAPIILGSRMLVSDYNGLILRMVQEDLYNRNRCVAFEGRGYYDVAYRPRLEIEYEFHTIPTINYYGNNVFEIENVSDMELIFDDIVYEWNINNHIYYGKVVEPACADTFDVSLEMILVNRLNDSLHYHVGDTVCAKLSSSIVLSLADTLTSCDTAIIISTNYPHVNYTWNTGEITESITVRTPGTYSVALNNQGCYGQDTVVVLFGILRLGLKDTMPLCGATRTLSVGYPSSTHPRATYQWDVGETSEILKVSSPGTYYVEVSENGCTTRDSIVVVPFDKLKLKTPHYLCDDPIALHSNYPRADFYLWSTGARTENITVSIPGTYWLEIRKEGCISRDETEVKQIDPVELEDTLIICNAAVEIQSNYSGTSYLWSTGDTTVNVEVDTPGIYWVEILNEGCLRRDSVLVLEVTLDVEQDLIICDSSIMIHAYCPDADSYLWNTFEDTESILVSDPGTYWVEIEKWGCVLSSSTNVLLPPALQLGDTVILCNNPLEIRSNITQAQQYLWSTGQVTQSIVITDPGDYWLELIYRGCALRDTVTIISRSITDFEISSLGDLCIDGDVMLSVSMGDDIIDYLWNTGERSPSILIARGGTYSVTVSNGDCSNNASITVLCPCDIWLPNIFTPNSDNINEEFLPVMSGPVDNFLMHIYDRWGSLIYRTTTLTPWDGTCNGKAATAGVYTYIIRYSCLFNPDNTEKKQGSITLVR